MIGTTYWAWLGSIYLIIMTWKDYKNNMNVDDRYNFFMMGLTISLYSHFNYKTLWILFLIILVFALRYILGKMKPLGEADLNSIMWIFLGFSILNIYYVIYFFSMFISITILYSLIKHKLLKIDKPTPFYMVILFSFIFNCLLFGLYLR